MSQLYVPTARFPRHEDECIVRGKLGPSASLDLCILNHVVSRNFQKAATFRDIPDGMF